ncbi:MAG: hypothetical protein Q4E69_04635 [Bacilli bacterium]|nr:hypothetical protein [Bacilli bacterium]
MNYELKRKINNTCRLYICSSLFITFFVPELVIIPMSIGTIKVIKLIDKNNYKVKKMSN